MSTTGGAAYNRPVSSRPRPAVAALVVLAALAAPRTAAQPRGTFAARVAALSEPGGYFDTDNLISNERSYLQVLPDLQRLNVTGGAYVGVGPDQNFSYIAAVRPRIAFIIDVRRDNLLLHLLFKALFELSRTRIEYVSLLFGREVPADLSLWRHATIDRIAAHAGGPAASRQVIDTRRALLERAIRGFGVPLSSDDLATIARFHRRFIDAGPELRFQSTGRPPQPHYPSYRELLFETDPAGRQANYLAADDSFQFVKSLESQDLVVPVVGDVSGPSAMAAIGRLLQERQERVSAFYISNVELYLFRQGSFARFLRNLGWLPHASNAVVIRAVFGPYSMAGRGSTSQIQRIDDLLEGFRSGRLSSYEDVVVR